ncbi:MAG: YdcF family protein [Armatimonadota bacterium]
MASTPRIKSRLRWLFDRPDLPHALAGAILTICAWQLLYLLGIRDLGLLPPIEAVPVLALGGAAAGMTRLRWALWGVAGAACLGFLIAGFTPWIGPAVRGLVRNDGARKADAVVVLAAGVTPSGVPTPSLQGRSLRAYELIRSELTSTLVLTCVKPPAVSPRAAIEPQLKLFRIDCRIEEVGPVTNTRDEALAVARLAAERGWDELLLVTDATHTRRAAAVFEKAGVKVRAVPGINLDFDVDSIRSPGQRLRALREWLHEVIGFEVYRRRGWI